MSEILSDRIPLELEGTPVSSIMIEEPFTCTQDCTISDVVRMLAENEVSSMPVIDVCIIAILPYRKVNRNIHKIFVIFTNRKSVLPI